MITLAEQERRSGTAWDRLIYGQFRASSNVLDRMTFDDAAAQTGGAAFGYSYNRQETAPVAGFRKIGEDFAAQPEVTTKTYTVECAILGGKFTVDRVVAQLGNGDRVAFEAGQKVEAVKNLFHATIVNGDNGTNDKEFDGLNVALAGTSTEIGIDPVADLLDLTAITSREDAIAAMEHFDEILGALDSTSNAAFLVNRKTKQKMVSLARLAGYLTQVEDAFGKKIDAYDGVPILDLGDRPGTASPVVGIDAGVSSIYVARFALDGLHGVSPKGMELVKTYLPKWDNGEADAVKSGAVEMVATVALKSTKAAAVRRNVKVG